MKKTYIQPSIEAIIIEVKQPMLVAMSGETSEFGPGGEQQEGTPTVNSRRFGGFFDDEEE